MAAMSIERNNLLSVFNGLLQPERFKDYGPNGLQVEGKGEIRRIVSGVTASRALIEAAIDARADAIFVHHGLFWRGMDGRITGWLKERIRLLLAHDINLFAYHLPLDAHAELGNNAQLGAKLGVQGQAAFGDQNLGWLADADFANADALNTHVQTVLGRSATLVSADASRPIHKLAWCTGALRAFRGGHCRRCRRLHYGEISEPQAHLARETGVSFIAAGHHATERYGAPAVADHGAGVRHKAPVDRDR